jgi:flagellar biosynthesis/type III secretory pathway chaperone
MPLETELAELLNDLSTVQADVLESLAERRRLLLAGDTASLEALQPREDALVGRLQACQARREQLLEKTRQDGRTIASLGDLAGTLPSPVRRQLSQQVRQASARQRLLQHESLTNWVLVQRSLLHLAQLLEIIATGGRLQPTYGRGEPVGASGALVDQAA